MQPTADISVKNNRVRKYGSKIYLDDGTEYQIELTNNDTSTYLARIFIDGKSISNKGIVLRPGEHVYLERYLDVDRKFKFSTYNVPDTKAAKKAVQDNGRIRVDFHKEELPYLQLQHLLWNDFQISGMSPAPSPPAPKVYRGDLTAPYPGQFYYQDSTAGQQTMDISAGEVGSVSYSSSDVGPTSLATNSVDQVRSRRTNIEPLAKKSMETGQTEQGDYSDQEFTNVDKEFENRIWCSSSYQILPTSQQKNVNPKELRSYCSNCGRRARKAEIFCPQCGNRN